MAIINQSPANQTSIAVSGIDLSDIAISGTPTWQSRKIVDSPSILISLGGGGSPSLPTTGQIWPSGF